MKHIQRKKRSIYVRTPKVAPYKPWLQEVINKLKKYSKRTNKSFWNKYKHILNNSGENK